jgi:hypothetical protein
MNNRLSVRLLLVFDDINYLTSSSNIVALG